MMTYVKSFYKKLILFMLPAIFFLLLPAQNASASAYMYDNTRTPAAGSTTFNARPTISIQTTTNMSGYTIDFYLDGAWVTYSYNGSIISYTPGSNLASGTHSVTVNIGWIEPGYSDG